ncbi:MAG: hypothetical protein IJT35_07870 [Paludibacteraceae bacterium]|nr:hypothetical protein [Paludibacteraceae bacterium]
MKRRLIPFITLFITMFFGVEQTLLSQENQEGVLPGVFSISKTKKVRFSQGNLQYQATTNTWRFAERQWLYVGEANNFASAEYNGWIDLFAWGTSGWEGGVGNYQPWSNNSMYSPDYYLGGNEANNMTGEYAKGDWGVYNSISNGGNQPGLWRTLSMSEWEYLLYGREGSADYSGAAVVNNVKGLVILPDNWITPEGLSWESTDYCVGDLWKTNVYDAEQWKRMEQAGAVFLPNAGYRAFSPAKDIFKVETCGSYWMSTAGGWYADALSFCCDISLYNYYRYNGYSVRLVHDVEVVQDYTPKNLHTECDGSIIYFMWDEVNGASQYEFAMMQDDNIIYDTQTKNNYIALDFSSFEAGYYEFYWGVLSLDESGNVISEWEVDFFALELTTNLWEIRNEAKLLRSRKVIDNGNIIIVMPDGTKYDVMGEKK